MSVLQVAPKPDSREITSWGARFDGPTTVACVIVVVFTLAAVFAPVIAPYDPTQVDPSAVYQGPSVAHLLGTDNTGRDILSRLLHGARSSLLGPAIVVLIAAVVGTVIAVSAAWIGGRFDAFVSRALDVIFAFPGLILAIVAVAVIGPGLLAPAAALSISYIPYIARVLRTAAIRQRNLPYIAALEVQGFGAVAICVRHLVPNLLPLLIVQATVSYGYALLDLSAISFLGLGTQPPTPEWGLMVANGQSSIIAGHVEQSLYAGLTILVAVVAFNVLGQGLAKAFMGDDR
ncbi:ABC transporter permease [Microtetraspora sp. NBRC 16547]|uniref:ABC transporter permease n=1 Tax=Microtetraspora sp. NBRC 16547 TaxID=3030993 RepID=UPI0024A14745|nr:ABC transporter permease [Microtetraspora sp. NBRC 16547]GLW96765.1 peptide ABC transporter permease [Microtetraspora sp. NBRC 16547]